MHQNAQTKRIKPFRGLKSPLYRERALARRFQVGEGDDLWYGNQGGLCSENSSKNSDAAHELFLEINNEIPDPGGNYHFINELAYDNAGGDNLIKRDETI